jgi:hypothetical protein
MYWPCIIHHFSAKRARSLTPDSHRRFFEEHHATIESTGEGEQGQQCGRSITEEPSQRPQAHNQGVSRKR